MLLLSTWKIIFNPRVGKAPDTISIKFICLSAGVVSAEEEKGASFHLFQSQRKGQSFGARGGNYLWKNKAIAEKICFDFNVNECFRPQCKFNHKCAKCNEAGHRVHKCGKTGKEDV